jgi:tRNA pseudouridine(55) synthase
MDIITKQIGETMGELVKRYKIDHPNVKKACFCGRLDPMARGQVLLLLNENCKKMPEYLNKDKIYEFEIVLGFQTDTDDFLGKLYNVVNDYDYEKIKKKILNYVYKYNGKEFNQKFHNYSSKRFNQVKILKPFEYYEIEDYHKVKINNITFLEENKYNYNEWRKNNINVINNIVGEFRQKEISEYWSLININDIHSLKFKINVTSGFYIRQFVHDISININFPLLTFDINRINIII